MVWNDTLHSTQPGSASSTILNNGVYQPSTKTVLPEDGVYQPSTRTALPDDGLYHPMRYAGGQNQPIVPNTVALQLDTQTKAATKTPSLLKGLPEVPLALATAQSAIVALPSIQETTFSRASQPTVVPTASEDAGMPEISATLLPIPVNAERLDKLEKSDKPDKSHIYAILSVLAVTFLIAVCVLIWLRKQKKKREAILLRFHNQDKPSLDTSSLNSGQLKTLLSRMKSRGAASFETVIRSARKEHSGDIGTWPMNWWTEESKENQKSRNAHPHTSYRGFDRRLLKDLILQAKRTSVAMFYALSGILRQREPPKAHPRPRESRTSDVWSATINSSAETIFSGLLHSPILVTDGSHSVCKCIQEPTPAVLPLQQCLEPLCLSEVLSTTDEKVDQLSDFNGSSCTVSRVSTTSTRSGPKQPTNNVYQDLRPKLSSISLFRKDVYQVQMNYESRNESQLSLCEGQNVLITQILDDGWAYCQIIGSKKEGLAPRACISAWPVKRVITPPGQAAKPSYSPPRTPVSPVSWAQPRFYAYC
ncbi:hypothetical protein N7499_008739 [Penicillium canescens]|nr:hypothetical protein N7499_008739 [Penicillium canescens]KAJ6159068.1 hypothetical protein N7485_011894 [Penicillium canescens]